MLQTSQTRTAGTDKTDRRGLMKALDKSQNLLWFDASGRIVDANDNAMALLGYTADEIRRLDFFDLTTDSPHQVMAQKRTWLRISTGEHVHSECRFRASDGSDIWTSANYAALRHDTGETRRVLAILIDLTKWAWKPKNALRI